MNIPLILAAASSSLAGLVPFIVHVIILLIVWAVLCRFVKDGNIRWALGLLFAVLVILDAFRLFNIPI